MGRRHEHPDMKTRRSFNQRKRLFVYYDEEFLNKECPCVHKTSTPVRADFDLYEDIIFVPAKHLENNEKIGNVAFIKDTTSNKNLCVFPKKMKKKFIKAKINSKRGAQRALTLILCNIL